MILFTAYKCKQSIRTLTLSVPRFTIAKFILEENYIWEFLLFWPNPNLWDFHGS